MTDKERIKQLTKERDDALALCAEVIEELQFIQIGLHNHPDVLSENELSYEIDGVISLMYRTIGRSRIE
ncbi:hypothetical protein, partial [Lactobacillus sp. HT06-2]